jgi:hypothetical protein
MQLGCFGFVTACNPDEDICKQCPSLTSCQKVSYEVLQQQDVAEPSQKVMLKRHEKWARRLGNEVKTSTQVRENFQVNSDDKRIRGLNKNAYAVARVLLANEVNVKRIAEDKAHSYRYSTPNYLPILLDEVAKGQLATEALIKSLMKRLDWSHNTARTHANGFLQTLNHWKLLTRLERGRYEISL